MRTLKHEFAERYKFKMKTLKHEFAERCKFKIGDTIPNGTYAGSIILAYYYNRGIYGYAITTTQHETHNNYSNCYNANGEPVTLCCKIWYVSSKYIDEISDTTVSASQKLIDKHLKYKIGEWIKHPVYVVKCEIIGYYFEEYLNFKKPYGYVIASSQGHYDCKYAYNSDGTKLDIASRIWYVHYDTAEDDPTLKYAIDNCRDILKSVEEYCCEPVLESVENDSCENVLNIFKEIEKKEKSIKYTIYNPIQLKLKSKCKKSFHLLSRA